MTIDDSAVRLGQAGAANYPGLDAWRSLPISQQPTWQDEAVYQSSINELSSLPPLVFAGEVDILRDRLAAAAQGKAFLLQGGDCASVCCQRLAPQPAQLRTQCSGTPAGSALGGSSGTPQQYSRGQRKGTLQQGLLTVRLPSLR